MTDEAELERAAHEFRAELESWLEANLTDDVRSAIDGDGDEAFAAARAWNAKLVDAGYGAIAWPEEFGGRNADIRMQLAYNETMTAWKAPGVVNIIGVSNIAPAIMAYGTEEQKQRHLRSMLRGDEIWSQGMSEPEAGSDLASLKCRAERDGDHFVINGQKTWNSNGHRADWCQLYVRTNPDVKKHLGITCLLVDMHTPGIEARAIKTMAGSSEFAEVFLDDVRVPVSAVLGEIDAGWAVATNTLSHERAGVASMYLSVRQNFERLLAEASVPGPDGVRPVDSAVNRDLLMRRYVEVRNLEFLAKRMLSAAMAGKMPGAEGSVIKLAWSLGSQALSNTAVDVLGIGAFEQGGWGRGLAGSRSLTIAGGTTSVNKNIIGERVLGLPREPKPVSPTG